MKKNKYEESYRLPIEWRGVTSIWYNLHVFCMIVLVYIDYYYVVLEIESLRLALSTLLASNLNTKLSQTEIVAYHINIPCINTFMLLDRT
ncbi:MAG: hypothetical protein ACREBR_01215 [bacterium]